MKKIILVLLFIFVLIVSGCSESLAPFNQASTQKQQSNAPNESLDEKQPDVQSEQIPAVDKPVSSEDESTDLSVSPEDYDYILNFPSDKYPETALHIFSAIENGASSVCTIDREGADENRKQSLKGIETKKGYDRDEWPMAMCFEGGEDASVAYIDSSDNRGAGSWVGHQLSSYENGERVLFIVEKPANLFGTKQEVTSPVHEQLEESTDSQVDESVTYKNCTEVREAGAAPLRIGDPGYSKKLDRDGDGVACEV